MLALSLGSMPLTLADVENITRKELGELAAREGFASARMGLVWTERLVNLVARQGYDHRFGARPLQRTLERLVVTPLARWRVAHPSARDQLLRLDVGADETVSIQALPKRG